MTTLLNQDLASGGIIAVEREPLRVTIVDPAGKPFTAQMAPAELVRFVRGFAQDAGNGQTTVIGSNMTVVVTWVANPADYSVRLNVQAADGSGALATTTMTHADRVRLAPAVDKLARALGVDR